MTPAHSYTAYCVDPTCEGWAGVDCRYTGDTWTDPGWAEPDECPHCSGLLIDRNQQLNPENMLAQLLEDLECADINVPATVDELALMRVIVTELKRQAQAQECQRRPWWVGHQPETEAPRP